MTIDHDALRVKYLAERDKRLRPDGNDQYVEPTGKFAFMPRRSVRGARRARATLRRGDGRAHRRGILGIVVGARLKQAGIDDVRIIEAGGDFGGAWYWNRYPGAMCDTAAMVYLPLLEETGHMPSSKYVLAPEIFEHCRRIGTTFGLYDKALFSTSVTEPRVGRRARSLDRAHRPGRRVRAQFIAMGTGPLNRPKLPASLASRRSRATPSTRAVGTTRIPAATGPARR